MTDKETYTVLDREFGNLYESAFFRCFPGSDVFIDDIGGEKSRFSFCPHIIDQLYLLIIKKPDKTAGISPAILSGFAVS